MPKVSKKLESSMTLEDWDRFAQALPYMLKACEHLNNLEWYVRYELGGVDGSEELERAHQSAQKALKKLEGK